MEEKTKQEHVNLNPFSNVKIPKEKKISHPSENS